jgi:hypothetical protein
MHKNLCACTLFVHGSLFMGSIISPKLLIKRNFFIQVNWHKFCFKLIHNYFMWGFHPVVSLFTAYPQDVTGLKFYFLDCYCVYYPRVFSKILEGPGRLYPSRIVLFRFYHAFDNHFQEEQ